MTTADIDRLVQAPSLDELYDRLAPFSMMAGWNKPTPSLWPRPRETFVPMHWSYRRGKAALDAAGRLIDTSLAERRNLILFNPAEGNTYGTARTIVAAYQMILPGERARSHRHSPNALRLIVDAEPGTYTIVDGVKVPMAPNDVVLTPAGMWHGHGNDGGSAAYWIDFLDAPLIHLLEPMFFDPYPDEFEQIRREASTSPLLFRWQDVGAKLGSAARDESGRYGRQIELEHPMRTMGLFMIGVDRGERTEPVRTTANNVYAVVAGRGRSVVDGEELRWERGDVFVAPAWRTHQHQADEDAVLFRVTDEPVMSALALLRTTSGDDA
jgi:gentisate 1,2-dioxygenase